MKLIDADKLIKDLKKACGCIDALSMHEIINVIDDIAVQPKIGEWIPCSERLPENNKSVLVWLESRTIRGGHIPSIGGYQNNVWFLKSGVETESYPNLQWNVIAWQPLPEPYREDK